MSRGLGVRWSQSGAVLRLSGIGSAACVAWARCGRTRTSAVPVAGCGAPDYQQGRVFDPCYSCPLRVDALASPCSAPSRAPVIVVWRHRVAELAARAAAPIGAAFTFVCLATGSLWGRRCGRVWVWDARLTSVLIPFFSTSGKHRAGECFRCSLARRQADSVLALVVCVGGGGGGSTCRSSNSPPTGVPFAPPRASCGS